METNQYLMVFKSDKAIDTYMLGIDKVPIVKDSVLVLELCTDRVAYVPLFNVDKVIATGKYPSSTVDEIVDDFAAYLFQNHNPCNEKLEYFQFEARSILEQSAYPGFRLNFENIYSMFYGMIA
jgi:hypothetical protein